MSRDFCIPAVPTQIGCDEYTDRTLSVGRTRGRRLATSPHPSRPILGSSKSHLANLKCHRGVTYLLQLPALALDLNRLTALWNSLQDQLLTVG